MSDFQCRLQEHRFFFLIMKKDRYSPLTRDFERQSGSRGLANSLKCDFDYAVTDDCTKEGTELLLEQRFEYQERQEGSYWH